MSRDEATPEERQFAALLAAYDEALAAGAPPPAAPAQVGRRLADNLACLQLLNQLRPDTPRPPGAGFADAPEPGERYVLVRPHASGGIGEVWLAHDLDLGRDVALKELRRQRAGDPAIAARFLREARVTGRLQHPGIVPVYELVPGTAGPADPPFYTMRFVQGRTLSDAARDYHRRRLAGTVRPLEQAALLNAFVSVCNTVAYAHSRGVIHRDLKGENIVLGDFGEVIVLDWGFAKLVGQTEADDPALGPEPPAPPHQTLAGQVVGTPAYMAPEQAEGQTDRIGVRTDVYGLGAILFEVLTGRPPYTGADSREVLEKVRSGEPPRPEAVGAKVPPPLAAVCRRAMARDPEHRYATATELAREVQHWLADEPVEAYREPAAARLRRWGRRHRPLVAGLAVLVATGFVALAVGSVLFEQERAHTAAVRAEGETERASSEARARRAADVQLYFYRIALAEREVAVHNLNRATEILDACPRDLRGWEWNYLKRLCHADPLTLRGHTAPVAAVAFSPDGRHLASAGHDRTVRIWDTASGHQVAERTGHTDVVYGLAYSPDGDRLATASWDHTVKIWDADGRDIVTFRGHGEPVWRVAFSSDGTKVVSLSNLAVKVWDAATGAELRPLGPVGWMSRYGLAVSPVGPTVAVTSHDRTVTLWDLETGQEKHVLRGHTSIVKNVAFSPDGNLVASGAGDIVRSEPGEVKVWEADTGSERFTLPGHTDPIYAVAFSLSGERLASASQDHTVKLWDTRTGKEVLTIRAHTDTVRAVAFSPNGWQMATACVDGVIKLWDATPWTGEAPAGEVRTLAGHGAAVFGLAYHPDGRRLFALSDNETIRTWDAESGRELEGRRETVSPQVYALALSPKGDLLATATTDGAVVLLDPETLQRKGVLRGHGNGPVKSLAFSSDGRRLAIADWSGRAVWVWDVQTGAVVHTMEEGHTDAVVGVAFRPDGRRLASASHDQTIGVWDAGTGRLLQRLTGHTSRVLAVAYSPDGRILASASNDGTIRLWEAETGKQLGTPLSGHASGVYAIAFSPDGKWLASGGNDWTVKVWDPATGAELHTFRGHTDRVHAVAFRPDGKRLASASSDQTVKVWDLSVVQAR